ncbi:hypothetical protein IRP63_14920 (plasmid) [Clostridium botulinum]|uniref:hypothetical protein n=1 Tax=Clostridium botulinum TaxID=1491 RepID=UPI00068BE51B|nr:hypothetical protein [Clostridium botulinum]MCD3232653.1 hypothetical protein [Clostridium botulinum D/C]MCD3238418.1 hypothetical protein [Clostridium botulinum D/C]MCD3266062.1 hypothetical protein [Clostridium botulinum D/C]MCD3301175.1 hypothetical protein [Clostridium botulinum D/C]MCD3304301.1 hypothetical protein [Clostridium botulinum D/C]
MPQKRMSTTDFKVKVFNKHKNKVEIISDYKGGIKPIKFIYHCSVHGDTYKTINAKNILAKSFQPCDECRKELQSIKAKQSLSKDDSYFYERLKTYVESKGGKLISKKWTYAKDTYTIQCNEGHIFKSTADSLVNKPQWCPYCSGRRGDFENEINSIIKQKNGTLLSHYKSANTYVKVKCNIHNYVWNVMPLNIKKGKWCPICNLPYSEKVVYDYLIKNKYNMEVQYTFDNLISKKKEKLKFDFAILNQDNKLLGLIEVDDVEHRYNTKDPKRIKARLRDKKKDEYCKSNNIPLFRMIYKNNIEKFREYDWYYMYIDKQLKDYLIQIHM